MIDDVDIGKMLISNLASFGKKGYKYFIGCKDDDYKVILLCIMSGYVQVLMEVNMCLFW